MKKVIQKLSYFSVTAMLLMASFISITPSCWALHYQPEVPKSLRR